MLSPTLSTFNPGEGGWDCAHERHQDKVESDPDKQTECGTLPELNSGEIFRDDAVEEGKDNREGEVDDERINRQVIVSVERNCRMNLIGGHPKLLEEHLWWVCCIALGGARRERNFPSELNDCGKKTTDEADGCCCTNATALGISLFEKVFEHLQAFLSILQSTDTEDVARRRNLAYRLTVSHL